MSSWRASVRLPAPARALGALAIAATICTRTASGAPDEPSAIAPPVDIQDVVYDPTARAFLIEGSATGTAAVSVELGREGRFLPAVQADVRESRFVTTIGPFPRKVILAGTYAVRAWSEADRDRAQADEHTLCIGSEAEAESARSITRRFLGDTARAAARAFLELELRAGLIARARARSGGPADEARAGTESLDRFVHGLFRNLVDEARRPFEEMRSRVLLPAEPETAGLVGDLIALLPALRDARLEEALRAAGGEASGALRSTALELLGRIGMALGIDLTHFAALDLATLEEGDTSGDTYRSDLAGFEMARPDGYRFELPNDDPHVRLRMVPDGPVDAAAARPIAFVEVRDMEEARSADDLVRLIEVQAWERFTSYLRQSGRSIVRPDASLPEGRRLGYRLDFSADFGGRRFAVVEVDLFRSDLQRVVGVVVMVPEEAAEASEGLVRALADGLRVIDAP